MTGSALGLYLHHSMGSVLYLAECSGTYRRWIPKLFQGYVKEIVDLWETPFHPLDSGPGSVLVVDEAFVMKGPGPARMVISALLQPQKIVTLPVVFLMRRERPFGSLPHGLHLLRRPFYSKDLEGVLNRIFPEGRIHEEVSMSEDQNLCPPPAEESKPAVLLDEETLKALTREAVEKAVKELVPAMAEKMIRDEIRRLTE